MPLFIVPNPVLVGDITYINHDWSIEEKQNLRIEIIDEIGQVVMSDSPIDYPIVISNLVVRGLYMVRLISGTGDVYIGKIIVE